ncbi:hypothetical protein CPB86DRAFT_752949 [Serendipita vermifera]|nr:hypothetical protein CPB86DRAFT_752949 [Serendipita vermifera]
MNRFDNVDKTEPFSYPKPQNPLPHVPMDSRPFHPLDFPGRTNAPPQLPVEASQRLQNGENKQIIPGYVLTTHIFQAATPRTRCETGPTPSFPMSLSDRKGTIKAVAAELLALRERPKPTVYEAGWPKEPLWIVINRLTSTRFLEMNNKTVGGITMTFMHANGFHKETWEETLKATVAHHPAFNETVDEIWLLDSVNHGDSAVINEGKLGTIFNWLDNARDLIQFLSFYLPEDPGTLLPVCLEPLAERIATERITKGFMRRQPLVAVGHSLGGTSTCRAAISMPHFFSDVILVDPVIYSPHLPAVPQWQLDLLASAVGRRTEWPTRDAALRAFEQVPFFNQWHRGVLEAYVNFAMVEDKEKQCVRLKTSGYQEAVVFAESRVPLEVWDLLPKLDRRIELRWIMSGEENDVSGGENGTPDTVWRRDATVWHRQVNTSNVRMKGSGHLVTQTVPTDLGREIASYVIGRYSSIRGIDARL